MTEAPSGSRHNIPEPFAVAVHTRQGQVIVEARGELDLVTAPRIRDAVAGVIADGGKQLIVDLRGVSFMDSAGVHLLLDLRDMKQSDVKCRMIDGRPEVERVLELCQATDVLERVDPQELA